MSSYLQHVKISHIDDSDDLEWNIDVSLSSIWYRRTVLR